MANYYIELELKLNDGSHPRKWLCETIADVLQHGEDIIDYEVNEIETSKLEVKTFINNVIKHQQDLSDYWEELVDIDYNFVEDKNGQINVYSYPVVEVNGSRLTSVASETLVAVVIDGKVFFAE
jgi:hypothetical protein